MHLLVDPGFYPHPLNFYEASWFVPHRMDAPDRHNGQRQTNERTNRRLKRRVSSSVRPFVSNWGVKLYSLTRFKLHLRDGRTNGQRVRLLDGVSHFATEIFPLFPFHLAMLMILCLVTQSNIQGISHNPGSQSCSDMRDHSNNRRLVIKHNLNMISR